METSNTDHLFKGERTKQVKPATYVELLDVGGY